MPALLGQATWDLGAQLYRRPLLGDPLWPSGSDTQALTAEGLG